MAIYLAPIDKGFTNAELRAGEIAAQNSDLYLNEDAMQCLLELISKASQKQSKSPDVAILPPDSASNFLNNIKPSTKLEDQTYFQQAMEDQEIKVIIVPILVNNNHWISAKIDKATQAVEMFDSLAGTTFDTIVNGKSVKKHLTEAYPELKGYTFSASTEAVQKDGMHCGDHVLHDVMNKSGLQPQYDHAQIAQARKELLAVYAGEKTFEEAMLAKPAASELTPERQQTTTTQDPEVMPETERPKAPEATPQERAAIDLQTAIEASLITAKAEEEERAASAAPEATPDMPITDEIEMAIEASLITARDEKFERQMEQEKAASLKTIPEETQIEMALAASDVTAADEELARQTKKAIEESLVTEQTEKEARAASNAPEATPQESEPSSEKINDLPAEYKALRAALEGAADAGLSEDELTKMQLIIIDDELVQQEALGFINDAIAYKIKQSKTQAPDILAAGGVTTVSPPITPLVANKQDIIEVGG
ncbi:MAG: Ulp1 family isopeptidase [Pseudomonadota bacterium]